MHADQHYYDALKLRRDATPQQIRANYLRLVLEHHPQLSRDDLTTANHHFSLISEAYEVLSNPTLRSFYDHYGHLALQQGHFANGTLKGGYRFDGDPRRVFDQFYQKNNAFAHHQKGPLFAHAYKALNHTTKHKIEDLSATVSCTLNQLYLGTAKQITFLRKVILLDGITKQYQSVNKLVQIKPKYNSNTVLHYEGEGHEYKRKKYSTLILRIQEIPHEQFTRKGDNLLYQKIVSLSEAISCDGFCLRTLDGRTLRISVDEIIKPNTQICVKGEGMPKEDGRGDLIIQFHVHFPKQLPQDCKKQLRELLKQ